MRYVVINSSAVSFDTKIAAHHALASARKALKLPDVNIKWFVPSCYESEYSDDIMASFEMDQDIRGMFQCREPNAIYIRALQMDEEIKETVYHETYHRFQHYKRYILHEETAYEFSSDLMARMKAAEEDENVYWEHMVGKDWSKSSGNTQQNQMRPNGDLSQSASSAAPKVVHMQKGCVWPGKNVGKNV